VSFAEIQGTVGARLTEPQAVAAQNIINANVDRMGDIAIKLKETMVPDVRQALLRELDGYFTQNDLLISKLVKARTSAGRMLNTFRLLARVPEQTNAAIWLARAQAIGGDGVLTNELQDTIVKLVNGRDWPKLAQVMNSLRTATPWQKMMAWVRAGWLTLPKTHMVNFSSNTTMLGLETIKDVPGSFFDYVLSRTAHTPRTLMQPFTRDQIKALGKGVIGRETLPAVLGARPGGGVKGAMNVLRGGDVELHKLDLHRNIRFKRFDDPGLLEAVRKGELLATGNALADIYVNTVFRGLSAGDQLFKGPVIERALREQALVRARNRGFRGAKQTREADRILNEELNDEMWIEALHRAELATFQDYTFAGQLLRDVARGPLALLIPFTRTPGAIATRVVEYSPFGFVKALRNVSKVYRNPVADDVFRAQRDAVEELGRASTGSALLAAGVYLASRGLAVGKAPRFGSGERNAWDAAGMQENSVLLNGEWQQIGRLAPGGNIMALGAQIHERLRGEGLQSAFSVPSLSAAFGETLETVMDQPFLQGLKTLLRIAEDPASGSTEAGLTLLTAPIPGSAALGGAAQAIDPTIRETREGDTFGELALAKFMSRMPFLSKKLPARVNVFGEQIERKPGVWARMISPLNPREFDKRPEVRELRRVKAGIPRFVRLEGESVEDYNKRVQQFGDALLPIVRLVVTSPVYLSLPELLDQRGLSQRGAEPDLWRRGILETVIDLVRHRVATLQKPETDDLKMRQLLQKDVQELIRNPFETVEQLPRR
jgi:hypothetical protein